MIVHNPDCCRTLLFTFTSPAPARLVWNRPLPRSRSSSSRTFHNSLTIVAYAVATRTTRLNVTSLGGYDYSWASLTKHADPRLAQVASREGAHRPGACSRLQPARTGCWPRRRLREAHSARNGLPCADQGPWVWIPGNRNKQGKRRGYVSSRHVRIGTCTHPQSGFSLTKFIVAPMIG